MFRVFTFDLFHFALIILLIIAAQSLVKALATAVQARLARKTVSQLIQVLQIIFGPGPNRCRGRQRRQGARSSFGAKVGKRQCARCSTAS